jgi:hypothetical protein
MTFKEFNQKIQQQFAKMCATGKLFRVELTGQQVWDIYINGFSALQNPVFRDPQSSVHNCNTDKHFIKRYGNIVALDENNSIMTMFDIDVAGSDFETTVPNLSAWLKEAKIVAPFFKSWNEINVLPYEKKITKTQTQFQLGIAEQYKQYTKEEVEKFGVVEQGKVYTFNHFHVFAPAAFIDMSIKSVDAIVGEYRDAKNVFQRGMQEIPLDTLQLVNDLILQGSLLNGDAHLFKIQQFIELKKQYELVPVAQKDNWCWKASYKLPISKFRNELIGTLCVELAEGVELNEACKTWNKRVDPLNYMKAKAPITTSQIKQAQKFVEEEGYLASFDRRFATIDDIDVSEILHTNAGDGAIKTASLFDAVKATSVSTRHKRSHFNDITSISIETFMKEILPTATSVEAFLENRMDGNLVALITANEKNSKPLFKWSNNYSWTYNGNLAGKSQIKEAVKSAGGKVDGVLRFSITWNESGNDNSDLDNHCLEPNRNRIYFSSKVSPTSGGHLDVDIITPNGKLAVENITFPSIQKMQQGDYTFLVNQYSARNSQGFKAEIEFNGEVYNYEYKKAVNGNVEVAVVTLKNGVFSIEHKLPETASSKTLWGLESNEFHKVNLVSLSPNYWGKNNIGNKHYFFMMEGCNPDVPLSSFHNEYLVGELLNHRKVLECLSQTTKIHPSKVSLSGIGFNGTVSDELIVRVKGSHQRVLKIVFN